ncbi:MAG: alpha-glucosidase C-terminal domain-containing protein [Anaerolineae bacterium]|nr:alpha-glucosidase C-terminal domain-containing protein [Anaerolineae bacterium]
MTFPGAPSVYYGDEIGIRGAPDPDARYQDRFARWTFPWDQPDEWDRDLLEYFKAVIALRHAHPVLRRGEFIPLYSQGNVFAFARHGEGETLLVALNVGSEAEAVSVPASGSWKDGASLRSLFGSGQASAVGGGQTMLSLPAREGIVLRIA